MPVSKKSRSAGRVVDPAADARRRVLRSVDGLVVSERRLDRSRVLGPRAERTKQSLVDSAWELFRRRGYTDTTVADIAKGAGVSLATFYQYFGDITDVLRAIIVGFIKESLARRIDQWDVGSGRDGLRRTVHDFVQTYVDYRDLLELWETARLVDPGVRDLSIELRQVYRARVELALREAQEQGLLRRGLDPGETAGVLTAMLQGYCFEQIVMRRQPGKVDVDALTRALTDVWVAAVGLETT
jgi:AcrR family transcriptional regulator